MNCAYVRNGRSIFSSYDFPGVTSASANSKASPPKRWWVENDERHYPDVCSAETIEALFDPTRAIDLYGDVVTRATEWPTNDQSIKTLAKHLGFSWRDANPSGAASIEWFDQWVRTRDPAVKARILSYNEDDCRATRVLLDGVRALAL